jgi:lipopolysaccharide transport system permease protein
MSVIPTELRRHLDLLRLLTVKEITLKYKRTSLGMVWSLLNPLLMSAVYYLSFKIVMRIQTQDYTLFLLSVLFPWTWFSGSVIFSTGCLIGNVRLIKKVRFPKQLLVLSIVFSQLVNLLCAIPIVVILVHLHHRSPSLTWLIAIPLLLCIQFMLTFGIALIVSMVNVYFRDMEYIVSVLINMLFWLTPIIYPLQAIPEKYRHWAFVNPLTPLMTMWREVFMEGVISWGSLAFSSVFSAVILALGLIIFTHLDAGVDEVL